MTDQDNILKPTLSEWRYVPEFVTDAEGSIKRIGPPGFAHTSGVTIDLTTTKNLNADMLDAEGRTEEAEISRRIASNPQAFCQWITRERT